MTPIYVPGNSEFEATVPDPEHPGVELALSTSKHPIPNRRPRTDFDPALLRQWEQYNSSNHPYATCRHLSGLYNCVGMVFACRRTNISPKEIPMILSDDRLRSLPENQTPLSGDLALYKRDTTNTYTHIGVVIGQEMMSSDDYTGNTVVLSKWGTNGEYEHMVDDVPEVYGTLAEYWTHREG